VNMPRAMPSMVQAMIRVVACKMRFFMVLRIIQRTYLRILRGCTANAPFLWVARQPSAACVNRLGDSYGYPLRLAPCLWMVGAATRLAV